MAMKEKKKSKIWAFMTHPATAGVLGAIGGAKALTRMKGVRERTAILKKLDPPSAKKYTNIVRGVGAVTAGGSAAGVAALAKKLTRKRKKESDA